MGARGGCGPGNGVGGDGLRSGACREESRGGNGVQGKREAVEGVEASPWRREGVGEAATAKQEVAGALRARATPRLCLLAEEEEDKGGKEVGWAALGRSCWPPGKWLGCWWATR